MEDIYTFELDYEDYNKIVSGKKDIQLIINNNRRKDLAVGNVITFKPKEAAEQTEEANEPATVEKDFPESVTATIENLLYFASIEEAVEMLGKERCGFKPSATFDKATDQFLSNENYEKVEKNGLMAIVFKLN